MDHHQMVLDMAQDCLNKAKTEAVLKMCQNIITSQTAEITNMEGYLLSRNSRRSNTSVAAFPVRSKGSLSRLYIACEPNRKMIVEPSDGRAWNRNCRLHFQ